MIPFISTISKEKRETIDRMVYEYWKEYQCTQGEIAQLFSLSKSTVCKIINRGLDDEHGDASHIETSVCEQPHHRDTKYSVLLYLAALLNKHNRGEAMNEEVQRLLRWVKDN